MWEGYWIFLNKIQYSTQHSSIEMLNGYAHSLFIMRLFIGYKLRNLQGMGTSIRKVGLNFKLDL